MLRLLLDENVSVKLISELSTLGIEAESSNEQFKGVNDAFLLLAAHRQGRAIVTHNTSDFLLLHRAWLEWSKAWMLSDMWPKHAGMLLIHSAAGMEVVQFADVIFQFLTHMLLSDSIENRAFAWNATRGWHER